MSGIAAARRVGVVALLALAPITLGPAVGAAAGPTQDGAEARPAGGQAAPPVTTAAAGPAADAAPKLPVGEELRYSGRFGIFGEVGEGRMTVVNGETVRGREVVRLDFDFEGRAMLRSIVDRTTSWVEPGAGAALRYHKSERHPLGSRQEEVEIFPDEGRWEARHDGADGSLPTARPLDELSFIYLVRGLDLEQGDVARIERHFDSHRNPVEVEHLGSDTITVPAGEFPVDVLEMRVRDEERFNGGGNIVLYLARDEARTPVRIETKQSRIGTLVLSLEERHAAP